MSKIKIAHVLNSLGGVDVSLRLILENLNPELFQCLVIHGTKDTSKKFFDKANQEVKQYKLSIFRNISPLNDIRAILHTIQILRKEKPDVIHAHSAKGGIIARSAALFYPVTVLHTPQAYSYLSSNNKLKRQIFLRIEKTFKLRNSVLLASSESELKRGIEEVKYKKSKTELFNNSILPIRIKDSPVAPSVICPKNYICTVGRPSYQKNIEMMVEVVKEVKNTIPNIHLILMGLGVVSPNTENIKKLIETHNLKENITLVEWMDREEIFKVISDSKLYISTARYEGLPYSIIESLALGKAAVVTDCDGNRDLVKDSYNGYVIKNMSIKEMAKKIVSLYKDDKKREEMELNAKELFLKKFNILDNICDLESIYIKYGKNVNVNNNSV